MASVRISTGASGLPPDIVEQIMKAEREPLKQIDVKKTKQEEMLKLVTELETKVNDITKNLGEVVGSKGFMDSKLISGDPQIVDGSVDPSEASTGEYTLEVDQLAHKPGAITNGFPDRNETQIGIGYIKFETPEGTKEVYINGKHNTLDTIAAQITGSETGLRAMVVEDRHDKEAPFKLLVTGLATGDDNEIKFPVVYMLDGDQDFFFDRAKPAQNAKIKLDGFELELAGNVVKDLIPGVTLDLKQPAPGREVRVTIKENAEVITGKVKSFVDSYNAALAFIQNQHKLTKGANGKDALGPLGGDSLLRSVENKLQRIIQNPQLGAGSPIRQLNQLGIEFNRNGTLNFNADKFTKQLNTNPQAVAMYLRGDGIKSGFVPTLKRELGYLTQGNYGPLANRKKGISDKIENFNKQVERKEKQLEKREDTLRRQFADLDAKMSKIQGQGAAVAGIANLGKV